MRFLFDWFKFGFVSTTVQKKQKTNPYILDDDKKSIETLRKILEDPELNKMLKDAAKETAERIGKQLEEIEKEKVTDEPKPKRVKRTVSKRLKGKLTKTRKRGKRI